MVSIARIRFNNNCCFASSICFESLLLTSLGLLWLQKFQKCEYAKTKLIKSEGRGYGLVAVEDIKVVISLVNIQSGV